MRSDVNLESRLHFHRHFRLQFATSYIPYSVTSRRIFIYFGPEYYGGSCNLCQLMRADTALSLSTQAQHHVFSLEHLNTVHKLKSAGLHRPPPTCSLSERDSKGLFIEGPCSQIAYQDNVANWGSDVQHYHCANSITRRSLYTE